MKNKDQVQCTNCVMDTTDSQIIFDKDGICDHCLNFKLHTLPNWPKGSEADKKLAKLVELIKIEGKGKDFDCIIGLSGGIDSSYLTYRAHQLGLRPLVFHVDAGWNSQEAVNNIERLVDNLKLDLFTEVIHWDSMKELQLSFFKSGVSHIDAPQDHAFFATMYKFAELYDVKYILTGANLSTECVRNPIEWMYYQSDSRQLLDIYAKHGNKKILNFPTTNILRHKIYLPYFKNIKVVKPLNLMNYFKEEAINLLVSKIDWQPYSQKHFESRFTKFYEGFWLTKRFGYDVRKIQYSSLILTEQMTREEAINLLENPPYNIEEIDNDINFVATKLGISSDELISYLNLPKKTFRDFKSQALIYNAGASVMKLLKLEVGGKR